MRKTAEVVVIRRQFRCWYDMLTMFKERTGDKVTLQEMAEECSRQSGRPLPSTGFISKVVRGVFRPPEEEVFSRSIARAYGASPEEQRRFALAAAVPRVPTSAAAEVSLMVLRYGEILQALLKVAQVSQVNDVSATYTFYDDASKKLATEQVTLREYTRRVTVVLGRINEMLEMHPDKVALLDERTRSDAVPDAPVDLLSALAAQAGISDVELRAAVIALQAAKQARGSVKDGRPM